MDPDMNELPTDYTQGVDFRLTKASKVDMLITPTPNMGKKRTSH